MVFTIFFPEILAGLAQNQWNSARQSVKELSHLGYSRWSLEHAFLANMGGILLSSPDYPTFPINAHQVQYLVVHKYMPFPDIDDESIKDKNKADGFARLLTLVQVCWFALQIIGRATQHLTISTFELETVAFVACTIPSFYFWHHKPLDVSSTITLSLNEAITIRDIILSAGEAALEQYRFTPLDFIDPEPDPKEPLDPPMWALCYLFGFDAPPKHIPLTSFSNSSSRVGKKVSYIDWIVLSSIVYAYTSIHLVAWNFTFPTLIEQWLWRAAGILLIVSEFTYGLAYVILNWQLPRFCRLFGVEQVKTGTQLFESIHPFFQYVIAGAWVGSYMIARGYIFVEAFSGLRALPATAFQNVEWSNFLPHFS
jgi:hypothetical protein